ncbi:MAG: ABC transporter ATP-binding protein [Elusimicrobiota bacterium]|jgi:ABC-type dipeptide/oligopeptide/nickel transport system ATPase component
MLTIEHVSVTYQRRGQMIPAVRDVSLSVQPGEAVGVVGESGSGKSTLALAILRLIRPNEGRITQGRIFFQGQDLLTLPEETMRRVRGRQIAMIFQDPFTSLNPVLRIHEQMAEVLRAHGEACTASLLAESLEKVQLDPGRVLAAYPHQLSGGQRQRVMIASALLGRPQLLLADEPTTALDVLVQKEILELLFSLQRATGIGLVFISHHLALVASYSQRMIVMKEGEIVEEGPSQILFQRPGHPYTKSLVQAVPRMPV